VIRISIRRERLADPVPQDSEAGVQLLRASKQPVWAVGISPDGRWLAAGGGKAAVRVWDLSNPKAPRQLPDSVEAQALAFTAPDTILLSCWGRDPRLFRWPGGAVIRTTPAWNVYAHYSVAIAPDGHIIHGSHEKLACWNPATGEQLWEANPGRYWSRMVAGPGDRLAVVTDFRTLQLWDRVRGVRRASAESPAQESGILALDFAPDGKTLAVTTGTGLRLWDVDTWTERARINVSVPCTHLKYHPDGSRILGGTHSTLRLWDADLRREMRVYDFGLTSALSLTFAPDGLRAVAGGTDGEVLLWDLD
jgi:WD40 repeat protein